MALTMTDRTIQVRRNLCPVTRKEQVSDRAKRYRANQDECTPPGAKRCALCESTRFLVIDHKDGDEGNGRRSNLRWLCKACNTRLGARDAREGRGRRTQQYNGKGAPNLGAYMAALMSVKGLSDQMTFQEARQLIHDTPKRRRSEFASEIWGKRYERGTGRRSRLEEVPF